jgi:hypothetical protein
MKVMLKNLALNQEEPVWWQDPLGRKNCVAKLHFALRVSSSNISEFDDLPKVKVVK